jgi:hypothetical protein
MLNLMFLFFHQLKFFEALVNIGPHFCPFLASSPDGGTLRELAEAETGQRIRIILCQEKSFAYSCCFENYAKLNLLKSLRKPNGA